jgi:hypothetical protein
MEIAGVMRDFRRTNNLQNMQGSKTCQPYFKGTGKFLEMQAIPDCVDLLLHGNINDYTRPLLPGETSPFCGLSKLVGSLLSRISHITQTRTISEYELNAEQDYALELPPKKCPDNVIWPGISFSKLCTIGSHEERAAYIRAELPRLHKELEEMDPDYFTGMEVNIDAEVDEKLSQFYKEWRYKKFFEYSSKPKYFSSETEATVYNPAFYDDITGFKIKSVFSGKIVNGKIKTFIAKFLTQKEEENPTHVDIVLSNMPNDRQKLIMRLRDAGQNLFSSMVIGCGNNLKNPVFAIKNPKGLPDQDVIKELERLSFVSSVLVRHSKRDVGTPVIYMDSHLGTILERPKFIDFV